MATTTQPQTTPPELGELLFLRGKTGSGKSKQAIRHIEDAVLDGERILYVLTLKSDVREKAAWIAGLPGLRSRMVFVHTGDFSAHASHTGELIPERRDINEHLHNATVVIMTVHKLLARLIHQPEDLDFALVVWEEFDTICLERIYEEAFCLYLFQAKNGLLGKPLEEIKLIACSATIHAHNVEEIELLLQRFDLALREEVMPGGGQYVILSESLPKAKTKKSLAPRQVEAVVQFLFKNLRLQRTIIFVPSVRRVEDLVSKVIRYWKKELKAPAKQKLTIPPQEESSRAMVLHRIRQEADGLFPPLGEKARQIGVLYEHAQLHPGHRNVMNMAFRGDLAEFGAGPFHWYFCTTTIARAINIQADNIVICNPEAFSVNMNIQMMGRTGRGKRGICYLLSADPLNPEAYRHPQYATSSLSVLTALAYDRYLELKRREIQKSLFPDLDRPKDYKKLDQESITNLLEMKIHLLIQHCGYVAVTNTDNKVVFLSNIIQHVWKTIKSPKINREKLIALLLKPPVEKIGVIAVEKFLPTKAREDLANRLNALMINDFRNHTLLAVQQKHLPRLGPPYPPRTDLIVSSAVENFIDYGDIVEGISFSNTPSASKVVCLRDAQEAVKEGEEATIHFVERFMGIHSQNTSRRSLLAAAYYQRMALYLYKFLATVFPNQRVIIARAYYRASRFPQTLNTKFRQFIAYLYAEEDDPLDFRWESKLTQVADIDRLSGRLSKDLAEVFSGFHDWLEKESRSLDRYFRVK
jgi:hypothetical protein